MTGNPSLSRCLVCFEDGMAGWRLSIATSRLLAVSTEILKLKDCGRFSSAELTTGRCHPRSQPTACSASIFSSAPLAAAQVSKHGGLVVTHPQFLILPANGQWLARERCSSKEKPCMIFTDKSFLRKQANDFANGISTHL